MKKYFPIYAIILTLFFPLIAYAAAPVTYSTYSDGIKEFFNDSTINVNSTGYSNLCSDYSNHTNWKLVIGKQGSYYFTFLGSGNYKTDTNIYVSGQQYENRLDLASTNVINRSYTYALSEAIYFDNYDAFCEFQIGPEIDFSWTNVSFDASVPTPSIDVDLSKNVNEKYFNTPNTPMYGQLGPEIPYYIGFRGSEAYDGYYLYLDMTIWTPTSGELDLENGIYSFTPKSMLRTEDIAYLDWEDMKTAPTTSNFYYQTNAPLTGSTLLIDQQENLNTWYNLRRHIEDGTSDYPEMSYTTSLTGSARETGISRINQMLRNASLAGNRVRFRACLYYINENFEIKCGNFATWTSAQPSKPTSEQPSTNAQVVDSPASGISQTVSYDNIVSENENNSSIPPVNVTTGGTNVNVTVNSGNQNVPNNQNYPTVVSYNHDNIFTTFIGTYNNASQYLGGFTQFCNSCLLWIPSEIWSIIGMGFAMALVIMIVKIL